MQVGQYNIEADQHSAWSKIFEIVGLSDMTGSEASGWPVNALGEIVLRRGTGPKTVVGTLPTNLIPVHPTTQMVGFVEETNQNEWVFLQDGVHIAASPLVVAAGVKTKLTFDFSNLAYSTGSGLTVNFSQADQKFLPTNLNDVFIANLRAKVVPTAQAGTLDLLVESPTASFNPIVADTSVFNKGAGQIHFVSVFQPIFISQDVITNGIELYVKPFDTDVSIYDYSLFIQKAFVGVNS